LFVIALVITLTLALVFSIIYVSALLTFTSSFSIFAAYVCLVLCLNLINLTLIVRTFAFAYTSMLLKSSFVKVKEHAKKSYSLIVISCFITLLKIAFRFVASYIMSKYYFFKVLCLLQTALRLSFTFIKTALSVKASNSMSLFITAMTVEAVDAKFKELLYSKLNGKTYLDVQNTVNQIYRTFKEEKKNCGHRSLSSTTWNIAVTRLKINTSKGFYRGCLKISWLVFITLLRSLTILIIHPLGLKLKESALILLLTFFSLQY
jgi:hypothetical protein